MTARHSQPQPPQPQHSVDSSSSSRRGARETIETMVLMSRGRGQSEAIAMMESPSDGRDGDSVWAPLSDFHGEPLDSTVHAGGIALLGTVPTISTLSVSHASSTNNTGGMQAVDSKRARQTDYKMARRPSSRRHFPLRMTGMNAAQRGHSMTSGASDGAGGDDATAADSQPIEKQANPPTLFNRKHIGLLISVALASLLSTWLKRGLLQLMQTQLKMQQYQVDAAELLLLVPWSCSFLLGFLSDLFPIFGSHRKAYMVIGWSLSAASLAAMAILNHSNDLDAQLDDNERAPIVGGYIFLLGAACFGEILSIMMAEIYVIALSKREVLALRGHLVGTFLLVQFGFQVIGQIITDTTVFNVAADGKTITPSIDFQDAIWFLAGYSLLPIPIILKFFDDHLDDDYDDAMTTSIADDDGDERRASDDSVVVVNQDDDCQLLQESSQIQQQQQQQPASRSLKSWLVALWCKTKAHWQLLWTALEEKATWQIVSFLCVFIFFSEFTLRYPFLVLDQWSGVTAKTISTGKIFTEVMFFLAVLVWKTLCVNTKWGTFVVSSYLAVFIFPPLTYFLLIAFRVGSTYIELYMFVSSFQGFIRALAVVLEVVMMIEIAPRGGEGAVLGTIVSIAAIMRLVSQTFSNSIGYLFGSQFLLTNRGTSVAAAATASTTTDDEPMLVATALILCYTLRLFALLGVVFLPSQKLALRRLLAAGGRKRFRAWWTLGVLFVALLLGTLLNSLVVTPDTTCLHALGGSGCD